MNVVFIVVVQNVVERLRWDRVIARIVGSHWSGRRRNDMKLLVTWLKKDGSCRFWTNAEKVEQAAMSLVGLRGAVERMAADDNISFDAAWEKYFKAIRED